jgi:hypothetical protein
MNKKGKFNRVIEPVERRSKSKPQRPGVAQYFQSSSQVQISIHHYHTKMFAQRLVSATFCAFKINYIIKK